MNTSYNYGGPPYGHNYNQMNYQYAQPYYQSQYAYHNPQMQSQPPTQQNYLSGQMVDSLEVVKAKDVDLTGAPNYYPSVDGKHIYVKQLMMDGTSSVKTFILSDSNNKSNETSVNERLDRIESLIGKLVEELK